MLYAILNCNCMFSLPNFSEYFGRMHDSANVSIKSTLLKIKNKNLFIVRQSMMVWIFDSAKRRFRNKTSIFCANSLNVKSIFLPNSKGTNETYNNSKVITPSPLPITTTIRTWIVIFEISC